MSVTTEDRKDLYDGNGTGPYPITFPFADDDHIKVQVKDPEGEVTTLAPDKYTVTGLNVTTVDSYGATYEIAVYRDTPLTQEVGFQENGVLSGRTLETALDKLTMIIQEFKEAVDRIPQLSLFESELIPLPTRELRINKNLGFDENGDYKVTEFPYLPSEAIVHRTVVIDETPVAFDYGDDFSIADGGYTCFHQVATPAAWLRGIQIVPAATGITVYAYSDSLGAEPYAGTPIIVIGDFLIGGENVGQHKELTIELYLRRTA